MSPHGPVREQYADFAEHARGDSPCFAEWSAAVAEDGEVLAWLADLPPIKQQPNLVLAAARWHGVAAPGPYAGLREALLGDAAASGEIRVTILARATQTNEAGRLATLVPAVALAAAGRPVALVEVGASAGLGQRPEDWAYRWRRADGTEHVVGSPSQPGAVLACDVDGPAPLPRHLPEVVWRVGLDLHPLSVADDEAGRDAAAWLETLVWPEHDDRRAVLRAAVAAARAHPPDLRRGDMLTDVPDLVAQARAAAGPDAAVVVLHSAVVAYLTDDDRARYAATMTGLVADGACHWVSNEAPRVLPAIAATDPSPVDPRGGFVLAVDGRAVAHTHGHGRWLRWFG